MSEVLDCCGLKCPQPVLKTKKALETVEVGQELQVLTDDPHAIEDLALFCRQGGHTLLEQRADVRGQTLHVIRQEH